MHCVKCNCSIVSKQKKVGKQYVFFCSACWEEEKAKENIE